MLKYFLLRKNINETKDDNKKIKLEKELKEKRDKVLDLETKLKNSELSTEEKDDGNKRLKEPIEIYDDMVKKNHLILMVLIKMVFINILIKDMILMVLIKMVFIKILIINIILMVLI